MQPFSLCHRSPGRRPLAKAARVTEWTSGYLTAGRCEKEGEYAITAKMGPATRALSRTASSR